MPRYVDLDNPKIIRGERDRFGLVVYHIPPDTPCLNLAERKQEAIDALEKIIADHPLDGYEDACELITALKAILSAQPELVKESRNIVKDLVEDDTISRKAAIDAVRNELKRNPTMAIRTMSSVRKLPSAQTEPLTDKEQRIFLAAMGREEEVCKEVDRNYTREPYEDSLVRVCREITRKVKGALWT